MNMLESQEALGEQIELMRKDEGDIDKEILGTESWLYWLGWRLRNI